MEARRLMIIVAIALSFSSISAYGQSLYGQRLASKDGKWLLPVATRILGSTDDDHVRRGSINSWDLSAAVGSPVWAAAPGVVQAAGCNLYESRQWARMQGYGCSVELSHGNGISSQYGHCAPNTIRVKRGDQVTQNTLLCQVGRTGVTSFDHTHFTILRNGSPIRIDSIFDINQMQRCHLCSGKNDPNAPVANGAVQPGQLPTATGQQSATGGETFQMRVAGGLRLLNDQQRAIFLWLLILIPMWLVWVSGGIVRTVVVSSLTSLTIMVAVLWWLNPVIGQPVMAAQAVGSGSATWRAAYAFMRRWEGARCVHDPVRTFKGITNGTYNAWRMSQGMGAGDVCRDLTEQQAESIYYQRYWVASGADKLSPAVAIAHFDHAVNAGVGAAKGILAQCGDNIDCYIKGRLADYRTKKNYPQYGRAWQNRVNDLVRYLQKGS